MIFPYPCFIRVSSVASILWESGESRNVQGRIRSRLLWVRVDSISCDIVRAINQLDIDIAGRQNTDADRRKAIGVISADAWLALFVYTHANRRDAILSKHTKIRRVSRIQPNAKGTTDSRTVQKLDVRQSVRRIGRQLHSRCTVGRDDSECFHIEVAFPLSCHVLELSLIQSMPYRAPAWLATSENGTPSLVVLSRINDDLSRRPVEQKTLLVQHIAADNSLLTGRSRLDESSIALAVDFDLALVQQRRHLASDHAAGHARQVG